MRVVGEAADGAAAMRLHGELRPDVTLMDLRMPSPDGVDGVNAIEAVRAADPEARRLPLTGRELQILDLVAKGLTNREIASIVGLAEFTVKNHLKEVFAKLQATDRTEAVVVAVRRGLLRPT